MKFDTKTVIIIIIFVAGLIILYKLNDKTVENFSPYAGLINFPYYPFFNTSVWYGLPGWPGFPMTRDNIRINVTKSVGDTTGILNSPVGLAEAPTGPGNVRYNPGFRDYWYIPAHENLKYFVNGEVPLN